MLPDYPHKLFSDERDYFNLLMETLAIDTRPLSPKGERCDTLYMMNRITERTSE